MSSGTNFCKPFLFPQVITIVFPTVVFPCLMLLVSYSLNYRTKEKDHILTNALVSTSSALLLPPPSRTSIQDLGLEPPRAPSRVSPLRVWTSLLLLLLFFFYALLSSRWWGELSLIGPDPGQSSRMSRVAERSAPPVPSLVWHRATARPGLFRSGQGYPVLWPAGRLHGFRGAAPDRVDTVLPRGAPARSEGGHQRRVVLDLRK